MQTIRLPYQLPEHLSFSNVINTNKLSLNLDKSSYLIIMPKEFDRRVNIGLRKYFFKYKSVQTYLGVITTDGGNLKHDVSKYIEDKRSNVLIKLVNFCKIRIPWLFFMSNYKSWTLA